MTTDGTSTEATPELDEALGRLLSVVHRFIRLAARETGERRTAAVWNTLSVLRAGVGLRVGDLADRARVAQPTMTKIVDGLADSGWIERVADPADGRASVVLATPAGLAALDDWRARLVGVLHPRFADLDDADVAAVLRTVDLLEQRIGPNVADRAATAPPREREHSA
jgi:DNA-binding MarR family transcriptional regulator